MGGRVVPLRVGGTEVLVETSVVAGSEPTSALDRAGHRVVDAFDRAEDAILGIADSVVATIGRLGERAARPDRVEVEFGLKFSVSGSVIVAQGGGEATLRVLLSYGAAGNRPPTVAPGHLGQQPG